MDPLHSLFPFWSTVRHSSGFSPIKPLRDRRTFYSLIPVLKVFQDLPTKVLRNWIATEIEVSVQVNKKKRKRQKMEDHLKPFLLKVKIRRMIS